MRSICFQRFWHALIAAVLTLALSHTAAGASLSFTPAGNALDADPILDLLVSPGQMVTFTIHLDTTGLPDCSQDPLLCLGRMDYQVQYDPAELVSPSASGLGVFDVPGIFVGAAGNFNVVNIGGSVPHNTMVAINVIEFTAGLVLPNNGVFDFKIVPLAAASVGGAALPFPLAEQEVEVQAIPEPESLALLWLGLISMVGLRHRRGKRVRQQPALISDCCRAEGIMECRR